MKKMVYFIIAFLALTLGHGWAGLVSAQTFPKDANQKLVIRETKAFSNAVQSEPQFDKDGTLTRIVKNIPLIEDDPSDPVTYHYYTDKTRSSSMRSVEQQTLARSEGDYLTQLVIVNWTLAGAALATPNLVTMSQARAVVFDNNPVSVMNYISEVSDNALLIKSKTDPSGDVFTINIQHPIDNCDYRLLNEIPELVNAQLPAGNKFTDVHVTYLVFNEAIFQTGACTRKAQANVSKVRSMQMGNLIWMPEGLFVGSQKANYHELLHTLGLGHSSMAWSNGSPDPLTWPRFEYGDPACIMGGSSRRLNSYQAHKLNWYRGNTAFKELQNGTYHIVAPTVQGGIWSKKLFGTQNGYITARDSAGNPNGQRIYPEIRQNVRFDDFYSVTSYRTYSSGVSLRWGAADVTASATRSVLINTNGSTDPSEAPITTINQPFTIWNIRVTLLSPYTVMSGARINFAF